MLVNVIIVWNLGIDSWNGGEFRQIFVHVLGLFTGPWPKVAQISGTCGFFWSIFDKY